MDSSSLSFDGVRTDGAKLVDLANIVVVTSTFTCCMGMAGSMSSRDGLVKHSILEVQ